MIQDSNKNKETFADTAVEATEVGGDVAEIGAEIATEGTIETVVGAAGELVGGAAQVAEVIGGVLGGIDGI